MAEIRDPSRRAMSLGHLRGRCRCASNHTPLLFSTKSGSKQEEVAMGGSRYKLAGERSQGCNTPVESSKALFYSDIAMPQKRSLECFVIAKKTD